MRSATVAALVQAAALLPQSSFAQSVFAHVIVGNTAAYDVAQWTSDVQLASSYGIDGFVLNIVSPATGTTGTQITNAFDAVGNLTDSDFKLLFSFDYLGGGFDDPWADDDILALMTEYGPLTDYYKVDGKPMVSTFEGPSNSDISDWPTINSSIPGGIYFVPDWTSLGPDGFDTDLVDGAFSWNMWPDGPNNISTTADVAWTDFLTPASKSYMMGVSPWFYTDLPGYDKAWVWRGDDMWYRRWTQVLEVLPEFVEIVTWNDFGESHYVGPIYEAGVPSGTDKDATVFVDGYPHSAWLETLPYQIAAYKNAYDSSANVAPSVDEEKIVFWYRTSPASAGTTDATGNDCPSAINGDAETAYQTCYPVDEVLEDGVFAIVLASQAVNISIAIGDGEATVFDNIVAGISFVSRPFSNETGNVTVRMGDWAGEGVAITAEPASGVANFNAWVGVASA